MTATHNHVKSGLVNIEYVRAKDFTCFPFKNAGRIKLPVSKATTVFLVLILIIRVEHDLKRILNGTEALREEIINKIRYIPALRIYSKHAS